MNSHVPGLRRGEAVDGNQLNRDQLMREGIIEGQLPAYSAGSLGHAMSHRAVWQECIAKGIGGTVAEDDAVFNLHFAAKSARFIASLPADWDVVLWGWNFDSVLDVYMMAGIMRTAMLFEGRALDAKLQEFRAADFDSVPMRLNGAFGNIAYSASPQGMKRLLEKCFPLRHETIQIPALRRTMWNVGLDTLLNKIYPTLKAYVPVPPLVWTENKKADSDINRNQAGPAR